MQFSNNQIVTKGSPKAKLRLPDINTSKKSKTSAQKKEAKSKRSEILDKIVVPSYIELVKYDSKEWKKLAEGPDGEYWKAARGMSQSLVNGDKNALRTTAFEGMEPETVRDEIFSLITQKEMLPIEEKFRGKFGPMAAVSYDKWADKVHDAWKPGNWNPDERILMRCVNELASDLRDALIKQTGKSVITPLEPEEAFCLIDKSKNSGWPFFSKKWGKDNTMSRYYLQQAEKLLAGIDTLSGTPHMLFKRVQNNGMDSVKMRPVKAPPKHDAIAGKCLTEPLVQVLKTMPEFCGFNGGENVWQHIGEMMKYHTLVEADFSEFDNTAQEGVFYVKAVIRMVTPKELWPYLDIVFDYYTHTSLVTPLGIVKSRNGGINGVNSGDAWTSLIGTLYNSLGVRYHAKKRNKKYKNLAFGDDIALATDEEFDAAEFESDLYDLGLKANHSKQSVSTGPKAFFSFLGYYHFRHLWKDGNQGIFPIMRLASGMYFKEKWEEAVHGENSDENASIRLLGYALKLNVAKYHVNFSDLVSYFRKHEPLQMSVARILSVAKHQKAMRCHRTSGDHKIENSLVILELLELEACDPPKDPGKFVPQTAKKTIVKVETKYSGPTCDIASGDMITKFKGAELTLREKAYLNMEYNGVILKFWEYQVISEQLQAKGIAMNGKSFQAAYALMHS